MTDEFDSNEARRLWRQVAQPARRDNVSALELASWLDGKADAALAARVERAMVADDSLLEMALAARAASETDEPAPERLLVRARAMVAPKVTAPKPAGFLSRLGSWQRSMQWAAISACFLIAASGGFWMGDSASNTVRMSTDVASFTLLGVDEESTDLFDEEI
jgi:hypothetical protein